MLSGNLPKLITFDGEARTGKGTIVKRTRLMLEAENLTVKHIDGGQIFRALAVCAGRQQIDIDDPTAVDFFLSHADTSEAVISLLNQTSKMSDEDREAILYTPLISERCAKIGARPQSQTIAQALSRDWVASAKGNADVVLLDGRVLEHLGREYDEANLVEYVLGFYFFCDEYVGAKRYLGFATIHDEDLTAGQRTAIDDMARQITERNRRDQERPVEPLIRPDIPVITLPDMPSIENVPVVDGVRVALVDTSADLTKAEMSTPVLELIRQALRL